MIMSPVRIEMEDGKVIKGALLDEEELSQIIGFCEDAAEYGLKGEAVKLLFRLKEARRGLIVS